MKCKNCGFDVPEINNGFCPNCKKLLYISNSLKSGCFVVVFFLVAIISNNEKIAIISLFGVLVSICFFIFWSIKDSKRLKECQKMGIPVCYTSEDKTQNNVFKSFFLSIDKVRENDGNLKRGECEIEIFDDKFQIRQGTEIIEQDIASIYCFGIWEYKDDTYFKFRMRSLNEIKFCSQHFESSKIANILREKGVTIEDNYQEEE